MRQLKLVFLLLICMGIISFLPNSAWARVHGQSCANCHIMHNSQDGGDVVTGGPVRHLLAKGCIACHTGDNAEILSGGTTPYVYNTSVTYGTDTLAGGNFYWVATAGEGNDTKGHNVLDLSAQDTNIPAGTNPGEGAPGGWITCANSCHSTLAAEQTAVPELGSGCEGCHIAVAHHADDSDTVVGETGGWFRYCAGHMSGDGYGVEGIEDDDWQLTEAPADHNEYLGFVGPHGGSAGFYNLGNTMTAYCCGCHGGFHNQDAGAWIRHPSDAYLPGGTTEYAAYPEYSTEAPVARPDLSGYTGPSSVVTPDGGTDMVMCLSCHRAHGSPYPDMLRWDYDSQIAGGGGAPQDTGCFTCHTTKDD